MVEEKLNKKQVSVRNHKKMPGKRAYFAGITGILLLVVLAFLGPQIVFKIQDMYQTGRLWQGTRTGLDMEAIYSTYGSLRERLVVFAERLDEEYKFYVADTEYQRSAELVDMLDMILDQAGYEKLEECGIAPQMDEVENRGYTIDQIKKYVIYNDVTGNESNAVVVSAWIFEFTTRHDITVKLLVDTETYTIYYVQISQLDYYENTKDTLYWEKLYYMEEFYNTDWLSFWFDYLDAGQTSVQTFEGYLAGLNMKDKEAVNEVVYDKMNIKVESKSGPRQPQEITMEFPYGEHYVLQWQASVQTVGDKGVPAIFSLGLKDIADLIPELQKD